MKIRLGLISWATGTLLLAALSACGDDAAQPPPSTSAAPTTSDSPTAPSDAAATQASATVSRYFALLDRVRQVDSVPLSRLAEVSAGTQLTSQTHLVRRERASKLHQTGDTKIAELKVQSVDLDSPQTKVPTVLVDVCWDVGSADLVDQSGNSVVGDRRVSRGWTRYTVMNNDWADDPSGGWRVSSSKDLKQEPCVAS